MKRLMLGALQAATLALLLGSATQVWAEEQTQISLFKVIVGKHDVLIGLNDEELEALGGQAGIERTLGDGKELTAWRYSARKLEKKGDWLVPLEQVHLVTRDPVKVQPFSSKLPIAPHE